MLSTKIKELNEQLKDYQNTIDSLEKEYLNIENNLNDCYLQIHQKLIKNHFYENMRIPVGVNKGVIISEVFNINSEELPVILGDRDYSEIQIIYKDYLIYISYFHSFDRIEHILCILNIGFFDEDEFLSDWLKNHIYPKDKELHSDDIKMEKIYRRKEIERKIEELQKELKKLE